jgi:hypothetical protein
MEYGLQNFNHGFKSRILAHGYDDTLKQRVGEDKNIVIEHKSIAHGWRSVKLSIWLMTSNKT